jgi:hypothetical protein
MLALEETAKHLAGTLTKTNVTRLENTWKNADKCWDEVADSEHVWEETKKRILSKGDPALTAALADQMKADLRKTLSAIHGDIARHYAEKGMLEHAKFHVDAMLGDGGVDDSYRATIREVTKPVRDRLEAARTQAQSHANSPDQGKKKQAFAKARDFFENDFEQKAKPVLELFYAGGKVDSVLKREKEDLYNKAAETVLNCCVAAFNAKQRAGENTDDDTALLQKALDITTGPEFREKIKNAMPDPVLREAQAAMLSVTKDKDTVEASERFRRLQHVRPKLQEWAAKHSGEEACKTLLKTFAMLERSLSVEIFNKEDDIDLAIDAIRCAINDTPDAGDREKYEADLRELKKHDEPKELIKIFNQIAESSKSPSDRFDELLEVRVRFQKWADSNAENPMCHALMKAFASLARGLSVSMFNEGAELFHNHKGYSWRDEAEALICKALAAICVAIEDTPDADARKKFLNDYEQIKTNARKLDIHEYNIPKPNLNRRNDTHARPGIGTRLTGWVAGIFK